MKLNMNSMKSTLGAAALLTASIGTAQAAPIIGASVFWMGGDVTINNLVSDSSYVNVLGLFEDDGMGGFTLRNPPGYFIGEAPPADSYTFTQADLLAAGYMDGDELVFGILVDAPMGTQDDNRIYLTGSGARNPDGLAHAAVEFLGGGAAKIGFEDFFNGGDEDYNDIIFDFVGVRPAPAPGALLLSGLGLLGLGLARRRKV